MLTLLCPGKQKYSSQWKSYVCFIRALILVESLLTLESRLFVSANITNQYNRCLFYDIYELYDCSHFAHHNYLFIRRHKNALHQKYFLPWINNTTIIHRQTQFLSTWNIYRYLAYLYLPLYISSLLICDFILYLCCCFVELSTHI